ncbi:energy transducer TonB [Mucilaginibacter sp. PPCGB 2223]|uniref:energy transducer TonB n=1 Tax=Mucilaginibacter sp. PPCGB 2223 TaxID=1886027 RepID=UPI0008265389|nr:energy transducer TonB [Mucilaginibacter sp. PPCGB 2223]OCX50621.1 energy transducer TonB [Mucilaginibacter sp. PPCGB 2223]
MIGSKVDIFNPEWLNVVFKGRNQAYGAYELRKENPRNTNKALVIAILCFVFVLASPTIWNKIQGFIPKADQKVKVTDVVLMPPPPLDKQKPPPPPPKEPPKPKVDQVRFPPPVVKPDNEVREKDPPTEKQLEVADPGQKEQKGDPNQEVRIDEPVGNADVKNVTEATDNQVFTAVEINPEYPGGEAALGKFLQKNIRYPSIAKENNIQGKVYIQFVVERDGSLTDIKVIREPGSGTGDEAVRVLKMSPHWKPGVQNGKPVRVQFTLPVNFSLGDAN